MGLAVTFLEVLDNPVVIPVRASLPAQGVSVG